MNTQLSVTAGVPFRSAQPEDMRRTNRAIRIGLTSLFFVLAVSVLGTTKCIREIIFGCDRDLRRVNTPGSGLGCMAVKRANRCIVRGIVTIRCSISIAIPLAAVRLGVTSSRKRACSDQGQFQTEVPPGSQ